MKEKNNLAKHKKKYYTHNISGLRKHEMRSNPQASGVKNPFDSDIISVQK